jgi:1-acyl-sn-glycerol-3-phosphate acyltransferase
MRIQPWFAGTIAVSNRDLPAFGGCLTVSNHRSHLDAFILLSHIQGVRILSRKSLFRIPFLGWMMRAMRQIPVESGNVESFVSAMDRVREWIEQGERVHVFPEMTRCPPGMRGTQEFIAAPFHAAIKAHAAVFPIVFLGTDDVWPKGSFSLSFRRKVEARLLDPILPGQFTSAAELRSEARRRIDEALR